MIVESYFSLGSVQKDGRLRITEAHKDDVRGAILFEYGPVSPKDDHNAIMLNRAVAISEQFIAEGVKAEQQERSQERLVVALQEAIAKGSLTEDECAQIVPLNKLQAVDVADVATP